MGFPETSARLSEKTHRKTQTSLGDPSSPCRNPGNGRRAGEDAGNANTAAGVRAPTWQCCSGTVVGKGLKKLKTDKSGQGAAVSGLATASLF